MCEGGGRVWTYGGVSEREWENLRLEGVCAAKRRFTSDGGFPVVFFVLT